MYYKHIKQLLPTIILAAFSSSFTPSSDQLVISPYSISTLSLRKVSRIQKSISLWILFDFIPNSQGQNYKEMTDSEENSYLDLSSERDNKETPFGVIVILVYLQSLWNFSPLVWESISLRTVQSQTLHHTFPQ